MNQKKVGAEEQGALFKRRRNEIPDAERVLTLQEKLYQKAKQERGYKFYVLYDKMFIPYILREAWKQVKANDGNCGVDGTTIADVEQYGVAPYLAELGEDLRKQTYQPQAVKRVMIDKADGMLILEKSKKADLSMRIFNADGSEAKMCGNGARCAALLSGKKSVSLSTGAGIINANVMGSCAKIQITEPKNIKLDIPLKINSRLIKVNFIDTGVPHVVVFVNGIEKIDVDNIGQSIRNHVKFSPAGTNVNFVQILGRNLIQIRTYERGVEGETLACGTGSTASAVIFALKNNFNNLIH